MPSTTLRKPLLPQRPPTCAARNATPTAWNGSREADHGPHAHHAHFHRGGHGPLGAVGIAWDSESTGLWLNFELNDRGTIRTALVDALALLDSVDEPNDVIGMLVGGGGPGGLEAGTFCAEATVRWVVAEQ